MGIISQPKWIFYLWICYILSNISQVAGDCSDSSLNLHGGAVQDYGEQSYGCYNGCPPRGRQVHVIAQIRGNPSILWNYPNGEIGAPKVTVHMGDCISAVPITLVLINHETIYWYIKYHALNNLNIVVYKHPYEPSIVEGPHGLLRPLVLSITELEITDILHLQYDQNTVRSLIQRLSRTVIGLTSINVVEQTSQWELTAERLCCNSENPGGMGSGKAEQDMCLTPDGHTTEGGSGHTAGGISVSCHNGCPTSGPQVHVIGQLFKFQYDLPKVDVHIQSGCNPLIALVIIYHQRIKWVITPDNLFQNVKIIVYRPRYVTPDVSFASEDGNARIPVITSRTLSGIYEQFEITNIDAVNVVVKNLKRNDAFSTVTSFNVAEQFGNWQLNADVCCRSTASPEVTTGFSSGTHHFISTMVTESVIRENNPQAGEQEANKIPLVAGLVSLLVVVGAVTAGIAFYLYRQKTKSSLASGTSPSADPNIYSESPNVTDSNGITRDDPPPNYGEVEYEQAATVTPPVIPPRANRP